MSICILFILFNGSGYLTPACYDDYGLTAPDRVAFVQHIPLEYDLYKSPDYYLDYYWDARRENCRSWGQGWSFWTPQKQAACEYPQYSKYVHYYRIPYRVRSNVKRHLKAKRHHYHYKYKNSYNKHWKPKKYKKYGSHKNYKKRTKKRYRTSYKKYKAPRRHHANRPKRRSHKR